VPRFAIITLSYYRIEAGNKKVDIPPYLMILSEKVQRSKLKSKRIAYWIRLLGAGSVRGGDLCVESILRHVIHLLGLPICSILSSCAINPDTMGQLGIV